MLAALAVLAVLAVLAALAVLAVLSVLLGSGLWGVVGEAWVESVGSWQPGLRM